VLGSNMKFNEFVEKKGRQSKRQLSVIEKLFESAGLKTSSHIEAEEPFVYIYNTGDKLSFDGVRVYNIGGNLAYRVQKEEKTHPYGKAYAMDLESMYNDLLSDNIAEDKAAAEIIKSVVDDLKNFFEKSSKAEQEIEDEKIDKTKDPLGKVVVKTTGTDYSNQMHSKGTNYGGAV